MNFDQRNRKPFIYYYMIVMGLLLVFNMFIYPNLTREEIAEVDYGTFLREVNSGNVVSVEVREKEIGFITMDAEENETRFITGRMEDPQLAERLYQAEIQRFEEVIPQEMSPFVSMLFSWVIPLVIFIALGQFLIRRMQSKSGLGNAMSFGKSNAKVYVEAQTGKSFEDVAGQDEAKEALQEIVDFLHNTQKYTEVGAVVPKGALLVGPPGTGKTLLAKAVAGEAKVPFFSISGSEFVEMFVGMGAARVRDLFKQAQEKAPCIVFIDEIDTIGKSRSAGGPGGNDEREQTLNQLLSEMDGFDPDKGVIILAATNRPETLDKALLRPGRFDRRIPVELPDLAGREAILKVHAQKVKLGTDVEFNTIARATSGASGADLANMINEAALRAVKLGRKTILQSDLEESVEVVIAGYQRKNAVIQPKDKCIIAYHEIGHALVTAKLGHSAPVHKITIVPRTSGALGYTMQVDATEQLLLSKEQALDKITTYMGGRAAEELVFNSVTSGASNDIAQATKIARAMVTKYGMSDVFGMMALETTTNVYLGGDSNLTVSDETATKIDTEVMGIIKGCHEKARQILGENREKLDGLTKHLLEKETITGEEFMALLAE